LGSHLLRTAAALAVTVLLAAPGRAAVMPAYFAMNFVAAAIDPGGGVNIEAQLLDITYAGGSGAGIVTAMPAFPGPTPAGDPGLGLPDFTGLAYAPTYTTGGDGETTRTIGATVPIDWDMVSYAFPSIAITGFTAYAAGGNWTAVFTTPYVVGLIPAGPNSELTGVLPTPQGDIYDGLDPSGTLGNPAATAVAVTVPPAFTGLEGSAFGSFIFAAAAPVPEPSSWLLIGSTLAGFAVLRRQRR
jgi:hypothetical protein